MSHDFAQALDQVAADVNAELDRLIRPTAAPEGRVVDAMRYAVLDGGKRFRPFLVQASASIFGIDPARSLRVAAAVEMVHCYSLIHDDLPAMDNDDLRRGRPTVHKKYDEATAILAGDALLTLAFEVLAAPETHPHADTRAALVLALARAAGAAGMVGGQMIDLQAEHIALDVDGLTHLQELKTGHLIAFAAAAGAILAGDQAAERTLHRYGLDVGLAFQVTDDLLDVEGNAAATGKATGKDAASGKATFVSRLGVEGAKNLARSLIERAQAAVAVLGPKADLLRQAASFVLTRKS
ncbi:MAG: polyprenyl synthetase family protein [Rhodospirillaceae bacterium]|nr:polyprenyl synthetase family protein [Rhodospirillaceae bacterium]